MVETHWPELEGKELRYRDRAWSLTGDVDIRETGELIAVEATRVDDVRHGTASLYFGLQTPRKSLNPGMLVDHFDKLERVNDEMYLVVKTEGRTYRYELQRMEQD